MLVEDILGVWYKMDILSFETQGTCKAHSSSAPFFLFETQGNEKGAPARAGTPDLRLQMSLEVALDAHADLERVG